MAMLVVLFLQGVAPARAETIAGHVVLDARTGTILTESGADLFFIPASVAKLPATLGVLERLGPEATFTTAVLAAGPIRNGVVQGDLILQGGGDPMLDLPRLLDVAETLFRQGIKAVSGRVRYDASALPFAAAIDPVQPEDASYNPPLGGLSLNFNRYRIVKRANGLTGIDPPLDPLPIAPDIKKAILHQRLPSGTKAAYRWLPVQDPALFAVRAFQWALGEKGIAVSKPPAAASLPLSPAAKTLARVESPPVRDIVRRGLIYSNNMIFEMLSLAATGAKTPSEAGKLLQAAAARAMPGVPVSKATLSNASGLSSSSRMTPRQCAEIAHFFATGQFAEQDLRSLLPPLLLEPFATAVEDGESPLRAKSGSLYYARALAGVAEAQSGREIVFCVMSNDLEQREAYDAFSRAKRRDPKVLAHVERWQKEAREKEKALVLGWMSAF